MNHRFSRQEDRGRPPEEKNEKGLQVKETDSSTVVPLPTRVRTSPIRLGNIYFLASELLRTMGHAERRPADAPYVLTLDTTGNVHALLPDNPAYASSVGLAEFVCTFDSTTSVEQLAASLRAAVLRLGMQEIA